FVAPLAPEKAVAYWQEVAQDVSQGNTLLFAALDAGRAVGSVQLSLAWQPNAPHRAEVQKLLVHSDYRRRGVASRLMQVAEDAAKSADRWLLYLDTERSSGAEPLYEKLGYTRSGIIPQHSLNAGGEFADTVIFYKLLR
ncbi:MAG: GNAT family N-acetyltransferase, partial [Chloroflexota bacterium]